jgi:ligand-binding sensor domain-containing protein
MSEATVLFRKWWPLGAVAVALLFGARIIWRAHSALGEARERVASESIIKFSARPIDAVVPAGFETIGAPAVFSDAAFFNGHLLIAGSSGLYEYDSDGALLRRFRAGIELPPAPLTGLSVGVGPELWIATSGEGLVAYDGRGFRQIRAEDARYRKITAIVATETGRVLIGTEKAGVLVYDGREMRPFHSSLADVRVTALSGDDSSLWIGTMDRGLLHWNAGAVESIDEALPDKQVLSIALDGDAVYAGTALGVAKIRGSKFERIVAPEYFAQSLMARDARLWIGTLDEGMVELGNRRVSVCDGCAIRKIFRAGDDVLALADDSLWRGSQQILKRDEETLVDRNIAALAMGSTGKLWIGYFDRGLQILGGAKFEDDHLFCVNRIVHDPSRGVTAVATANGLVMFDSSTARQRVITHDDGLIANQITDVLLRADGTAVAATPAGVSFIDASGISSIYAFQGLVNNHVYALGSDGARTLAGTLGGLSVLDGTAVKASYTTANSPLKQNWITAIARVGDEYFVGTYGAGVLKTDSRGRWQSFDDLRGEIEINPNAMAVGSAVYAGTLDRGLAVYASGHWNFWTAGLPSRNVTAVEARGGVLYIGTDNGLVKIPESTVVSR